MADALALEAGRGRDARGDAPPHRAGGRAPAGDAGWTRRRRGARRTSGSVASRNSRRRDVRPADSRGSTRSRSTHASVSACSRSTVADGGRRHRDGGGDRAWRQRVRGDRRAPPRGSPVPRRRSCRRDQVRASSTAGADERVLHAFAAWRGQVRDDRAPGSVPHGAAQPDCAERTSRTDFGGRDHRLGVRPRGYASASRTYLLPPTSRSRPPRSSSSATTHGAGDSAAIPRSSDTRSHLAACSPPSSGSCRRASRSRSVTSSGFRCASIR